MTNLRISDRMASLEADLAAQRALLAALTMHTAPAGPPIRMQVLRELALACCAAWDVTLAEFLSPCRTRHVVRARWAATLLARTSTKLSMQDIGHAYRRDHSTLCHGCNQAARLLQAGDEDFTARLHAACAALHLSTEGTTK